MTWEQAFCPYCEGTRNKLSKLLSENEPTAVVGEAFYFYLANIVNKAGSDRFQVEVYSATVPTSLMSWCRLDRLCIILNLAYDSK